MSIAERLDRFQRRHHWAGFPIAVLYKFLDDDGHFHAALVTYYGFLALFPMLLLLATVLGLVLSGNPDLQQRLLDSALAEFPVIGPQLGTPERLGGGVVPFLVGVLVALYGALGLGQAIQHTMNTAWAVPRHSRPDPVTARGRSLLLLGTLGLLVLASTLLSAVGTGAAASGVFSAGLEVLVAVGSVLANAAVFVLGFRLTTARRLTVRQLLPGAVAAAVAWQLLQSFGGIYVARVVANASTLDAVFALVLGLMAFIYLAAVVLVVCVEVNVVRVDHLYPRALLTPFTDDVELTRGDERVYAESARAQRAVRQQRVDVSFEEQQPSAARDRADDAPA